MKLKLRHKSFITSLKKIFLKLKAKVVLCTKHHSSTTQIDNETTDTSTKETITDPNISLNYLDLILAINASIQQIKNTIAKSFYSTISVYKSVRIGLLTSIFDSIQKYNIQTHSIYHKKRLFI